MWLEVLSGEDAGRVVELPTDGPFVLGRVQGSDLVIRDTRASRRHAELIRAGAGVTLRDLDSANGTLVDEQPAVEVLLRGGERLQIGDVRIAVLAAAPNRAPAAVVAPPPAEPERPSWSMVGRVVDARTRRGRRATFAAIGVVAAAVAGLGALAFTGASEEDRVAAVVKRAAPATLPVEARHSDARTGTGSAWVLDRSAGLVVTAAHVVNLGTEVRVDGRAATVVAVAPCEDIAVLRVPGVTAAALELGAAAGARQGQTVLAFGFPAGGSAGEQPTATRGVVSAARADYLDPAPDVPGYRGAIRTDTALDPGFSGGPLVDLEGRVVGLNAAARGTSADGRRLQGDNYAVSAERIGAVLATLRTGRSIGWLGASLAYPDLETLADRALPSGLWVRGAARDSGAARAGLGDDGDLLVAVDGRPVGASVSSWCRAVAGIDSGDSARLDLVAAGGVKRRITARFR